MPAPISELLPLDRLLPWLSAHVPGFAGPVEAKQFASGQSNPTFHLRAASGDYVLRRKPPGILLKSAHAVDREFRVQRALSATAVPVPEMIALCADDAVLGAAFYVMDFTSGRNFLDPRLPDLAPADRGAIMDEMNRVLAALHGVDVAAVGLSDYGPPGNYFERQTGRWAKQYRASETGTIADMDALIAGLLARMPKDDGRRCLVHGDYRIDNMIFAADGPECRAVLDWELSTIGHPFADLAAVIMQWHMPPGDAGRGLAGVDRASLGLPSDDAFIAAYCDRLGIGGIDDFGFYLGFCFFRMGAIIQGVKKRALDGNASNPERALDLGKHVPVFAAKGLEALGHG